MSRPFNSWLKAYSHHTRHSESPHLFHFWTGVSTIAGALRRQVWIQQHIFQWTPNFYIILVGPPGIAAKSTSIRLGHSLLEQVEGVTFGPKSMTWQGLTTALEDAQMEVPMPPDGDYRTMSCLTCTVSELGTFLRPEDKELIDVLVDLWDGQEETWRRKLKEQSTVIKNPWINIIAATTPSWLQNNFPESMIGGGLTSRIVWVYGDTKRQLMAYPADHIDQEVFADEEKQLIEGLQQIAELKGEYELTKEAKAWGKEWYADLWKVRPMNMVSERYQGYISRKQTHIHKLAMVIAASFRDELYIDMDDLSMAADMVTALEPSMNRVFESIGIGDISRHVKELLAYIRAYGSITEKDLWRFMLPIMSPKEFEEATRAAIKADYIKREGLSYVPVPQKEE